MCATGIEVQDQHGKLQLSGSGASVKSTAVQRGALQDPNTAEPARRRQAGSPPEQPKTTQCISETYIVLVNVPPGTLHESVSSEAT